MQKREKRIAIPRAMLEIGCVIPGAIKERKEGIRRVLYIGELRHSGLSTNSFLRHLSIPTEGAAMLTGIFHCAYTVEPGN